MTAPPWMVRVADEKDRERLAKFACKQPSAPWSFEVERVIRADILDWALAPGAAEDDPRLLLIIDVASGDLVGVAAHERVKLGTSEDETFYAAWLYVLAIAKKWQGREFANGQRVSHVVLNAALTDIRARKPGIPIFTKVHKDNAKSLALCKKFGIIKETRREHPDYVHLITEHEP